jgi:hypothetical protein
MIHQKSDVFSKKQSSTIFVLLILMILIFTSQAGGTNLRPGSDEVPTPVDVLIFTLDLDEVKTADQSFVANVFLEYRWNDPRLVHQDDAVRVRPLDQVRNPVSKSVSRLRVCSP